MKTVLLCVVALVMVVQLPNEGEAVCCHGRGFLWASRCADCGRATPYCSKDKPCNIFGCNCKGGCRTGSCQYSYNHAHETPMAEVPAAREYDIPYDSAPYGGESEVAASNDNEVPAVDVADGRESEVAASYDYEVPAVDVADGRESEVAASNDYEMPVSEAPVDYAPEISSAEDVISTADENGDGLMDIREAERFLVKRGLATSGYRAKRSLRAFDLNNDHFISAEEIEQYE